MTMTSNAKESSSPAFISRRQFACAAACVLAGAAAFPVFALADQAGGTLPDMPSDGGQGGPGGEPPQGGQPGGQPGGPGGADTMNFDYTGTLPPTVRRLTRKANRLKPPRLTRMRFWPRMLVQRCCRAARLRSSATTAMATVATSTVPTPSSVCERRVSGCSRWMHAERYERGLERRFCHRFGRGVCR